MLNSIKVALLTLNGLLESIVAQLKLQVKLFQAVQLACKPVWIVTLLSTVSEDLRLIRKWQKATPEVTITRGNEFISHEIQPDQAKTINRSISIIRLQFDNTFHPFFRFDYRFQQFFNQFLSFHQFQIRWLSNQSIIG